MSRANGLGDHVLGIVERHLPRPAEPAQHLDQLALRGLNRRERDGALGGNLRLDLRSRRAGQLREKLAAETRASHR